MSMPRLLRWGLRLATGGLALALIGLIALIMPSADNGPYMTPFTIVLIGLITALVLLGVLNGLLATDGAEAAAAPDDTAACQG